MPPTTSRDFLNVAEQRLEAAEVLLRAGLTLDAQYLGGYTVECSLKALILELTNDLQRSTILGRITSGAAMHRPDVLLGELRLLGGQPPLPLKKRLFRFRWSSALRYETGKLDTGETIAFLKTAKLVYQWVGGQLP